MKNENQMQQGDVLIYGAIAKLPEGATKCKDNILALGEATGHKHEVVTKGCETWEFSGMKFVVVPDHVDSAVIAHTKGSEKAEHDEITIIPTKEARIFPIGIVDEVDPFTDEIERVRD